MNECLTTLLASFHVIMRWINMFSVHHISLVNQQLQKKLEKKTSLIVKKIKQIQKILIWCHKCNLRKEATNHEGKIFIFSAQPLSFLHLWHLISHFSSTSYRICHYYGPNHLYVFPICHIFSPINSNSNIKKFPSDRPTSA